jgi:hypothetical protein
LTSTSGFCDSNILGYASEEPTLDEFYECYRYAGLNMTDHSLCENLYPLIKNLGSPNLLNCYERFGISLTEKDIHEKCTNTYLKDVKEIKEEIENQQKCLEDLGMPKTADLSLIDPKITDISLADSKFVIIDFDEYK